MKAVLGSGHSGTRCVQRLAGAFESDCRLTLRGLEPARHFQGYGIQIWSGLCDYCPLKRSNVDDVTVD